MATVDPMESVLVTAVIVPAYCVIGLMVIRRIATLVMLLVNGARREYAQIRHPR